MIVIYKRVPEADIRKDAAKTIVDIGEWFKKNPKRKICNVEVWYGKQIKVHPKTIAEDINAAADAAIKG